MGFELESFYIGIIYDIKLMSYQQHPLIDGIYGKTRI